MTNNVTVIEVDELFPFYTLVKPVYYEGETVVSVSEEFIEEYNRIMKEFTHLQAQLAGLYKITQRG